MSGFNPSATYPTTLSGAALYRLAGASREDYSEESIHVRALRYAVEDARKLFAVYFPGEGVGGPLWRAFARAVTLPAALRVRQHYHTRPRGEGRCCGCGQVGVIGQDLLAFDDGETWDVACRRGVGCEAPDYRAREMALAFGEAE